MTAPWVPTPQAAAFQHDIGSVTHHWRRLHAGDGEPWPEDPVVLGGWVLYHNGDFESAARTGLAAGVGGLALANQATCIYANYVEPSESRRLALLLEVAERTARPLAGAANLANTWYWQGYALSHYSQGIGVAKVLAKGLGDRVRQALQTAICMSPGHVDAHLALANHHAEVIDKYGELIGGMTHGVCKNEGLALYRKALALRADSLIAMNEFANGLLMLEGRNGLAEATQLRERAQTIEPLDAMERLYLEASRTELENE